MNILLVCSRPPYPILGGLELRIYHLFRMLRANHQVSLCCLSTSEVSNESKAQLERVFHTVNTFPVDTHPKKAARRPSLARRFRNLWSPPMDYYCMTPHSDEMQRQIAEEISTGRFDVIHLMGIKMAKYIPEKHGCATVCDCVDDYALFSYRTARYEQKMMDKLRRYIDCLTAVSYERMYGSLFDLVTLVSPVDAAVMKRICPSARVAVVPNGVDFEYFKRSSYDSGKPVLMFSGVMDYEPNVTAVKYFCSSIFARIREEFPEAEFMIVGRDPRSDVAQLARKEPGVTVTGFVDDIRKSFDESLIYVAPLKSGAGMKNKILEAWAMEKPVVATSMSCDGINVSNGEDILIADKPAQFAEHVIELIRNDELRNNLTANARKKIVEQYGWDVHAEKLDQIYKIVDRENKSKS